MATVTVLGAGMMGSALCVPLADAGHDVRLVGTHLDAAIVESLRESGVHPGLGLALPGRVRPFSHHELDEAMAGAEVIGVGVSSPGVHWAGMQIAPHARPNRPIVMITKGLAIQDGSITVLPEVLRARLPQSVREKIHPAAVGGPCIAGELARRTPTCVVVAGQDGATLGRLASVMATDYYHVRTSTDVVAIEVCAALKNAYAMGVAFAWGMHERRGGAAGSVAMHNHEAAVFAQAVVEMQRIVSVLGANPDCAAGLAGAGDLYVTCNAGRTGRFGRLLGLGLSRDEAVRRMEGATLEALDILRIMREAMPLLAERGLSTSHDLPLLGHLAAVALDGAPVQVPFGKFA